MKTIKLTQGQVATIDYEDYERVNQYKWQALWNKGIKSFYAKRGVRNKETKKVDNIWMHRFIMGLDINDKSEVDHFDHNGTNNKKNNLRIVSVRTNAENRKDQSEHGVCVHYDKRLKTNPYQSKIRIDGKYKHLGMFATAKEAQEAREKYKQENGI